MMANWTILVMMGGLAAGAIAVPPGGATPAPTRSAVERAVFTPISLNPSQQSVYTNATIAIFPPYRDLVQVDSNADSSGRNVVYWLHQAGQPLEVVVERDGDRILLVDRTRTQERKLKKQGQVVSAYQTIGLPSRVFPGLIGVQRIPPETVPVLESIEP
jgi:hypothetical protein